MCATWADALTPALASLIRAAQLRAVKPVKLLGGLNRWLSCSSVSVYAHCSTIVPPEHGSRFLFCLDLSREIRLSAVLYFPPKVLEQLNQLAVLGGFAPAELISKAFKGHESQYEEFIEELMAPFGAGELDVWANDPLYALARAKVFQTLISLTNASKTQQVLAEEKKRAPSEWTFSSPKRDDDQADGGNRRNEPHHSAEKPSIESGTNRCAISRVAIWACPRRGLCSHRSTSASLPQRSASSTYSPQDSGGWTWG